MKMICLLTLVASLGFACGDAQRMNRADSNSANHAGMDHSNMNHADSSSSMPEHSMASSPDAEKAPLELQFLDTMIAHHQGAVDMANLVEARAQHSEVKELAHSIVADQEREIMQMSKWREQWYGENPKAINMTFPGMHEGMAGMDTNKLQNLTGVDFDIEFLKQMIPHHEGAVTMAKALIAGNAKPEVKELAGDIVRSQTAEVAQMKTWRAAWSK
jgi:uncharacterized protein (DUF305 family)